MIFPIGQWGLLYSMYVITKKRNGNGPITEPITEMEVAHAFEYCRTPETWIATKETRLS